MNAFLVAATALLASLLPPAAVCVRGAPVEGAIALQLCGLTTTLTLLCLAVGLGRPVYLNVAVIAAAVTFVSGLVTARMLGHRL